MKDVSRKMSDPKGWEEPYPKIGWREPYHQAVYDYLRRKEEAEKRKWIPLSWFGRAVKAVLLFLCAILLFAFGAAALVSLFTMQWGLFFLFGFLYLVVRAVAGD